LSDDAEKTHDATPRRRAQFRREGKFARARDAGAVVAIAATVGLVLGTKERIGQATKDLFAVCFGALAKPQGAYSDDVRRQAWVALLTLVAPPLFATAAVGCAVGLAQAGLVFSTEQLGFRAERLDPLPRFKDLFSPKRATKELLLVIAKVVVVGAVAFSAARQELPLVLGAGQAGLGSGAADLGGAIVRVTLKTLAGMVVLALVDYAESWFRIEKEMKMSLTELKNDMRSEEGDPKVKARMRSRARALAKRRMVNAVKNASIVVTNPTHIAVALRYDDGDPAPVVLAKGHDEFALEIRRKAREHGIPIVENRPLARTLDAEVAVGKSVKVEHFAAVARVLAFVFKLHGRRRQLRKEKPKVARPVQVDGP